MSLTYTTLKETLALYLKRDNLTDYYPLFIRMAEAELNRRLNVIQREKLLNADLTEGGNTVNLSTGVIALGSLYTLLNGKPKPITFLERDQFLERFTETVGNDPTSVGTPGRPRYFSVRPESDTYSTIILDFDREADQNYTIYYTSRGVFLLEATDENWLSKHHEDAYVFGSLVQAEPFLKNDKRIPLWRTMFEQVLSQIEEADRDARGRRDAILIPDTAGSVGVSPGMYNINEG